MSRPAVLIDSKEIYGRSYGYARDCVVTMKNAFTIDCILAPRGTSIDIEWPGLGKLAVLVRDEVSRFKGLKESVESRSKDTKPIKAKLTITLEEA